MSRILPVDSTAYVRWQPDVRPLLLKNGEKFDRQWLIVLPVTIIGHRFILVSIVINIISLQYTSVHPEALAKIASGI